MLRKYLSLLALALVFATTRTGAGTLPGNSAPERARGDATVDQAVTPSAFCPSRKAADSRLVLSDPTTSAEIHRPELCTADSQAATKSTTLPNDTDAATPSICLGESLTSDSAVSEHEQVWDSQATAIKSTMKIRPILIFLVACLMIFLCFRWNFSTPVLVYVRCQLLTPPKIILASKFSDFRYKNNELEYCAILDIKAANDILLRNPRQVDYVDAWKHPQSGKSMLDVFCEKNSIYTKTDCADYDDVAFICFVGFFKPKLLLSQVDNVPNSASPHVVEMIMAAFAKEGVPVPNGLLAKHCQSFDSSDSIAGILQNIKDGTMVVQGRSVQEDDLSLGEVFWCVVKSITTASYQYYGTAEDVMGISDKIFHLLHACVGVDYFYPLLVKLVVAAFPHTLLEADDDGNLPIHIAAKHEEALSPTHPARLAAQAGDATNIQVLLAANPQLARRMDPQGWLPLELAIDHRPQWTMDIDQLMDAFPEAAARAHPTSGKLPLNIIVEQNILSMLHPVSVHILGVCSPEAAFLVRDPVTKMLPLNHAIAHGEKDTDDTLPETILDRDARVLALLALQVVAAVTETDPTTRLPMAALAASKDYSITTIYMLLSAAPSVIPKPSKRRVIRSRLLSNVDWVLSPVRRVEAWILSWFVPEEPRVHIY